MALTDKNLIITPNIGSSNDPKIDFIGASAAVGPSTITATIYSTNNGTLSFDGTEGSLFSISNNLSTGSIFSVNPISGIPIIDVNADRTIALNPYGGNTGIGTTNPSQKLHVAGNLRVTGAIYDSNNSPGINNQVLKSTGVGVTWVSGSGSGVDADTLDGLTSDSFLRSDTSDTYSGGILTVTTVAGRTGNSATGSLAALEIFQPNANTDAFIAFHVSSDYAGYFGLDGTTNDLFWGGWSVGAVKNKIWHAGNDGAGSGLDADLFDGVESITRSASHRANRIISGGGTITVDASYNVYWNTRFIIISNGNGSNFSADGYFDITCPVSGTITGVGGASNVTATAAGIPLGAWQAIYYILPIGSGATSLAANFRVAQYTSALDIPHNWVLICVRNSDNGVVTFNNGITLSGGQSLNSIQQATANTANTLVRRDGSGNFTAGTITATTFSGSGASLTSIPNSATTATSANTASAIVARDGSGNFTAGTITATLSGTATTANNLNGLTLNSLAAPINPDSVTQNQLGYCNSVTLFSQTDGGLYSSAYSSAWIHQIFGDFRTGQIAIRGKNSGTWQAWRTVWDSSNDGTGSGLDADLLDGYNSGTSGANVVLRTDSNGYIVHDNYIRIGGGTGIYNANGAYFYEDPSYGWFARSRIAGSSSLRLQTTDGTVRGWFYSNNSNQQGFLNSAGSWRLQISDTVGGSLSRDGSNTIWDAGNDGAGSGLDADLLDGLNSTSFIRSDANQTATGAYLFSKNNPAVSNASYSTPNNHIEFRTDNGSDVILGFHKSGVSATALYHSGYGINSLRIRNADGNDGPIFTTFNDGAGSGLDADLLDGLNSATANTVSTIVARDGSGNFSAGTITSSNLVVSGDGSTLYGPNSTWGQYLRVGGNGNADTTNASVVTTNGNLHIDAKTGAFATYLNHYKGTGGVAFGSGASTVVAWMGPDGDLWKGAADNTGSVYWHAANDGAGSGLDADTVDGLEVHTGTNNVANRIVRTDANGYIQAGWINTISGNLGVTTRLDRVYSSNDQYIRYLGLTDFKNQMGLSSKNNYSRAVDYTADSNYWVGSFGHNGYGANETFHGGSGFFDIWSGTNYPSGLTHIHGINMLHYTTSSLGTTGGNAYGWQMAAQYDSNAGPWWRRCNAGTFSAWSKIWSDVNDGAGSGLDADLLDGLNSATANTVSTIVARDGSGNFSAGTITASLSGNATTASGLPTYYVGGQQTNPQVYFGQSVGLRVAMTGVPSVWADTLWINGYSGSDVLQMCALHTLRNGTPRMYISAQASNATSYGTTYEFFTTYNDGAGSGLDADLLDGQQGSYYQDASNLNAGTVPVLRLGSSGTRDNTTFLRGDNTWATVVSGVSITDETTPATRYIAFTTANTGTTTSINVSSSRLTYNPSTSTLFTDGSVEIGATDSATQKFSIDFNETTDSLDFTYTA